MERGAPGAYVAVQTVFQTVLDLRLGQWLGPEDSGSVTSRASRKFTTPHLVGMLIDIDRPDGRRVDLILGPDRVPADFPQRDILLRELDRHERRIYPGASPSW